MFHAELNNLPGMLLLLNVASALTQFHGILCLKL